MASHSNHICLLLCLPLFVGGCSTFAGPAELTIRAVEPTAESGAGANALATGRTHLGFGRNADAITAFRGALRDQPGNAEALNGLAIAYDRIGRKDLAQRYFELAVASSPDDARYGQNLARFLQKTGRPAMAANLPGQKDADRIAEVAEAQTMSVFLGEKIEDMPLIMAALVDETALPASTTVALLSDIGPDTTLIADPALDAAALPETPALTTPQRPQFAVHRPSAPVQIKAAAIDPRAFPKAPGERAPANGREGSLPALPILPHEPNRREQVRLERVSLGEVRLVTRSFEAKPSGKGKIASRPDFEGFGARLASWLPAAIALEQGERGAIRNNGVLREAIGRMALERAVETADAPAPAAKEAPVASYAFFENDELVVKTLAAL